MSDTTTTRPQPRTEDRIRTGGQGLWAVLRLHRAAMWVWIVFVAGMAAAMLWLQYGPYGTGATAVQQGCGTPGHRDCYSIPNRAEDFHQFGGMLDYLSWLLRNIAPVVAGWAGGALIGREVERGTVELAWTQAVTPVRWLTEKLAVPGVLLAVGSGVLVLQFRALLYWADARELLIAGYSTQDYYFAFGPSAVAYVLLGLAVGVLTGFLARGTLSALGIAGVAAWGVTYLVNPWRTRIWPVVTDVQLGKGPFGYAARPCQWRQSETIYSADACLGAKPASLYWPVQLVETGFLLVLTALAVAAAYWLLRRRTP